MRLIRMLLMLMLILIIALSPISFANSLSPDTITGAGAVLMDQETGEILFDKNGSQALFPASTTKVLTALIILEDTPLTDIVTIDAETPFSDGSRIYLMEGEQVTVEQLLYAMLLPSANDAAVALAKHHSGTVQAFCQVMNQRAKALGATSSNFVNPNGLPDPNHVTSARDLALIACKAMENPTFRKIVSTASYNLPPTNKQPESRHFQNGNRLLHGTGWRNRIVINNQTVDIKWELADGIKTGYTHVARQCLVASAIKDGRRVIAVVLKSEGKDIYKDARIMLQHGLDDFHTVPLVKKDAVLGDLVFSDEKLQLPVIAGADRMITLPVEETLNNTTPELVPAPQLALPIQAGQIVGQAIYTLPGRNPIAIPLKAATTLEPKTIANTIAKASGGLLTLLGYLLKGLGIGLFLFLLWRSFVTWKRLKKRKRLQQLKNRAERDR